MKTLRLVDIARLLGVSKQRAHQLANERGFPSPVTTDARGRLWIGARSRRGRGAGAGSPGASRLGSASAPGIGAHRETAPHGEPAV
jgi:hypothetical protein